MGRRGRSKGGAGKASPGWLGTRARLAAPQLTALEPLHTCSRIVFAYLRAAPSTRRCLLALDAARRPPAAACLLRVVTLLHLIIVVVLLYLLFRYGCGCGW